MSFEIEVKDFFGNTSLVKGILLTEKQQFVGPKKINKRVETTFISLKMPDSLKDIKFSSGNNILDLKPIDYFEIIDRKSKNDSSSALLKIRLANSNDKLVQAIIENTLGKKDTAFTQVKIAKRKIKANLQLMGKNLYFLFENLGASKNLKFTLLQKNDTISYPVRANESITEFILPATDIFSDTLRIVLKDDQHTYVDSTIAVFKMIPGQSRKYFLFSDSLQITAGATNAYDTLLFTAEIEKLKKEQFNLPIFSDGFSVNTGKHILNSNIDLSVKIDSVSIKAEQIGFYSVNENELEYKGGRYDPQSGFVTNRQKSFSTFVVAADTIAPTVALINFRVNGSYKKVSAFRFKVTDEASGIGTDKNIEVYLDNQYLVPEWDPETDLVKSFVHFKPQQGEHKVTIICKDRAGNVTEKVIPVNIL